MSKYGWTKGSGLGADESGITKALSIQVEKRRRKADADGGGWAEPGGKGKIVGGKRKEGGSKFGTMTDVIVLQNMLENMPDLETEISEGLGQEIGEECGEKVGASIHKRALGTSWLTISSMAAWRGCILTRPLGKYSSSSPIRFQPCE